MSGGNDAGLHLISHVLCPYVQRAVIVLEEQGLPYRRTDIDLAAKPDWFIEISPLGKTPVLVTEGVAIFESAVIAEYLDETGPNSLHPTDALTRARHRGWIEFASAMLNDIAVLYSASTEVAFDDRRAAIRAKAEQLERQLGDGCCFEGMTFGLVDAAFGPVFRYFDTFDALSVGGMLDGLPKLAGWRARLAARPSVRDAVSEDYPALLRMFLARRSSHLGRIAAATAPVAA
jgi:glutathione S-transferase